jgi:hypothetical protein
MAEYSNPITVNNGEMIPTEYWNKQFGISGSLVYLYEQYQKKTRGYHLKLSQQGYPSMQSSWVMTELTDNIVDWDTAAINYYPSEGKSLWDPALTNQITIQESGFYNINVHLNMFNCTISTTSHLYLHVIRQISENDVITIATDSINNPMPNTYIDYFPTYMNKMVNFVLSVNSIYHLDANDILYVKLQPSIDFYGDITTSFVGMKQTLFPTAFQSPNARGAANYQSAGTQSSFLSSGYIGQTPSFFEISSLRLDN